jgi:hypothetical protein
MGRRNDLQHCTQQQQHILNAREIEDASSMTRGVRKAISCSVCILSSVNNTQIPSINARKGRNLITKRLVLSEVQDSSKSSSGWRTTFPRSMLHVGILPQHYAASEQRRPQRWRHHWYPTTQHNDTTQKTSTWRWRQHGPPKWWYPTTTLHGVTTQKTSTSIVTAVKIKKYCTRLLTSKVIASKWT